MRLRSSAFLICCLAGELSGQCVVGTNAAPVDIRQGYGVSYPTAWPFHIYLNYVFQATTVVGLNGSYYS